jgi:hypothetical protein
VWWWLLTFLFWVWNGFVRKGIIDKG